VNCDIIVKNKDTKMKKTSIIAILLISLIGCGESETRTVQRESVTVPNNSTIVLDENQSIGYAPNTSVTIVNMGDNSYYIVCDAGECPIHIDNSIDESSSDSSTTSSTTNSSTTTDSSTTTYVDSNTSEG